MDIRVRYAPSPTGLQHIGGLRTALFNYFFARAAGGRFILRLEDTDRTRYDPRAVDDLYATFRWLGIEWDEGPDIGGPHAPYMQSHRSELYRRYAEQLVEMDKAYFAYDSPQELAELRTKGSGYDRRARNRSAIEIEQMQAAGIQPVVRFRGPLEGCTEFEDLVLGHITRENADISSDPVLLKADGYPTYHLANVVDDHEMKITHVLRAQEWLPSATLHILLYQAFDWKPPDFAHIPMVLSADGGKLSKRRGAAGLTELRAAGYLPQAIINYTTLLGWSFDGTRELFTSQELQQLFSMERIRRAPAIFDQKKLDWYNGVYLRQMNDTELTQALMPYMESETTPATANDLLQMAVPLVRERLVRLGDAPAMLKFASGDIATPKTEELVPPRLDPATAAQLLQSISAQLMEFASLSDEQVEARLRTQAAEHDVRFGDLMMVLRMAIIGSRVSPPLIGSLRLIGIERCKERIERALMALGR